MSDEFVREARDGGDDGVWARFEQAQNRPAISIITAYLYDNAGTPVLSAGRIGLDNDSNCGVVETTARNLSVAGLTASCWARLETYVTGSVPSFVITSIAGATDPSALPASFTGAYVGAKGGYYVTATRRVISLLWINAAGDLEGIVNCLDGPNYAGYSTSDDAYDTIYNFLSQKYTLPRIPERKIFEQSGAFTAGAYYAYQFHRITTAAASFNATVPAASAARVGQRIRKEKIDTGAGVCTVIPTGADTLGVTGATAFPLRAQGDYIELECVPAGAGYAWDCIDSLSTLDSANIVTGATQIQNLPHGCGVQLRDIDKSAVCVSADKNWAPGEEINHFPNSFTGAASAFWQIGSDATNIQVITLTLLPQIYDKSTGAPGSMTTNKWKFRMRYSI